jgi:hypothetical protein
MIEDKDTLLDIACAAKRVAHTLRKSRRMPEGFLNMQLGLSNQMRTDHKWSGPCVFSLCLSGSTTLCMNKRGTRRPAFLHEHLQPAFSSRAHSL